MLGRFSSALQIAVEALAPPVPLHEDFAYHWKRLMKHYLDVTNNKNVSIELTNIPLHLNQLLQILMKEEEVYRCGNDVLSLTTSINSTSISNTPNSTISSDTNVEAKTNVPKRPSISTSGIESDSLDTTSKPDDVMSLSVDRLGPCVEYLLEHSLLDLLVTLGSTDDPPGMRQHVLMFIYKFITHIKSNIISHMAVFPPLQRLVLLCDGSTPSPTEADEINFLLGLTALIRTHPHLIPCFTSSYHNTMSQLESVRSRGSWSSDTGSQTSLVSQGLGPMTPSHIPHNNPLFSTTLPSHTRVKTGVGVRLLPPEDNGQDCGSDSTSLVTASDQDDHHDYDQIFPLLDSILSYIDSPDASVRLKACQALMLLISLPDDRVANLISSDSTLCCSRLANKLAQLYQEIPSNTHPDHIEHLTVSWGLDVPLSPCVSCEGCRQLTAFLSWFDFIDQILKECEERVCLAICCSFKQNFLAQVFPLQSLTCLLNLSIINKCLAMSTSHHLISALCDWLVDAPTRTEGDSVLHHLLSNWCHSDDQVVLETMRLFELVLERGDVDVWDRLLFVYAEDNLLESGLTQQPQLKGCEEQVSREDSTKALEKDSTRFLGKDSTRSLSTQTQLYIDEQIHSLLCIVPAELRSARDSGYEQYVSESHRIYTQLTQMRSSTITTYHHHCSDDSHHLAPDELNTPFLTTLCSSIRNIGQQDYQVNLELTSIVSRLAIDPEPRLFYLTTSPHSGLINALKDVSKTLQQVIIHHLDYKRLLSETRHSLLSASNRHTFDWSGPFECMIVLEELCKELAAIVYVKHKLSFSHITVSSLSSSLPSSTSPESIKQPSDQSLVNAVVATPLAQQPENQSFANALATIVLTQQPENPSLLMDKAIKVPIQTETVCKEQQSMTELSSDCLQRVSNKNSSISNESSSKVS